MAARLHCCAACGGRHVSRRYGGRGRALWLLALALAALGIGIANTGSLGLLVEAVPIQRIVTAMVVWSQIGIVGYLLGPLAGGIVAASLGYAFVSTVTAAAGVLVLVLLHLPVNRPRGAGAEAN